MEELALGDEKRKKSHHVRVRERRKRQIFIDVFPGQFPSAQSPSRRPNQGPLGQRARALGGDSGRKVEDHASLEGLSPHLPPEDSPMCSGETLTSACLRVHAPSLSLLPTEATPVRKRLQTPSQPDASTEHLIETLAGPSSALSELCEPSYHT